MKDKYTFFEWFQVVFGALFFLLGGSFTIYFFVKWLVDSLVLIFNYFF